MITAFYISFGLALIPAASMQILFSSWWARFCARRFQGPIQFWVFSLAPSILILLFAIAYLFATLLHHNAGG